MKRQKWLIVCLLVFSSLSASEYEYREVEYIKSSPSSPKTPSKAYIELTPRFGTSSSRMTDNYGNDISTGSETTSGFEFKLGFGHFAKNRNEIVLSKMSAKSTDFTTIGYNGVITLESWGGEKLHRLLICAYRAVL